MRRILFPLAAAALVASSVGVFAADTVTTGVIKAFDLKAMTLTLEDGTVYSLPADFKDPGLKVGAKVIIDWKLTNTKHMADAVTLTKS